LVIKIPTNLTTDTIVFTVLKKLNQQAGCKPPLGRCAIKILAVSQTTLTVVFVLVLGVFTRTAPIKIGTYSQSSNKFQSQSTVYPIYITQLKRVIK